MKAHFNFKNEHGVGSGEVAQELRTLVHAEDPGKVPSTHMTTNNQL